MSVQPPEYTAGQRDTTGVVGDLGQSTVTSQNVSNTDTEGPMGGHRAVEPTPPPVTFFDTTYTNGSNTPDNFHPVATPVTLLDTTMPSVGGTPASNPAYRAPSPVSPAGFYDTTRTDKQPGGSTTNPLPSSMTVVNADMTQVGSPAYGGPAAPGALPAAPAAPVATDASRGVLVTWTKVADPAGDPIRQYIVMGSDGGTTIAGANATSVTVQDITPDVSYTFRVAAVNRAGNGPYSPASGIAQAYNPDAPDKNLPAGLAAANTVNPIYRPDGTFKAGTGGTNTAPTMGASTPGAAASKQVTANWSAPTSGRAPTSYTVKAYLNGALVQTLTAAAGATSELVTFAASGGEATFTVQAVNALGAGVVSSPSAQVAVP